MTYETNVNVISKSRLCCTIISHFQLELWVPDDNIQIVDLEDIAINAPTVGTKCEIYGWSLTTIVRTLQIYATH